MRISIADDFYIDSYSENATMVGYLNYWHFDVTKLAQELYGADIIKKFSIMSCEHEFISEEDLKRVEQTLIKTWESSKEIYIPDRFCNVLIHFTNRKTMFFNHCPDSMSTFSINKL